MAITLPYLVSPGSIKKCLERIKAAATPDRVTQDFVTTKLQIKGGTGAALIPYLKKIGFVASDGSPTEIYKLFRNSTSTKRAAASAIRHGYKELEKVNEYFYELNDKGLLDLINQVTGAEEGNQVAKLTLSTLKTLKAFADFENTSADQDAGGSVAGAIGNDSQPERNIDRGRTGREENRRLNLSYTINLNLPPTTDQAVFNAIFRSLKEHLISDND